MLVLGAEQDGVFTVDEVQATARAYQTEAEIFPGIGHDMMLEPGWQAVAEHIASWLNSTLTPRAKLMVAVAASSLSSPRWMSTWTTTDRLPVRRILATARGTDL